MSFPRYPKYKDSGVEWLGEVPEHWAVSRLKHSVKEIYSGGTPESGNAEYWAEGEGESIPWVAIGDMTRAAVVHTTEKCITPAGLASKRLRVLPAGTLLYSMYASLGKVAVLGLPATINQAILGIVPDSATSTQEFLRYWLIQIETHLELFSSSNTQDNLNAGKVRALPLVIPTRSEQIAIAAFLDRETAKIDELVGEQRRLIELLKEKRQAVISHAVTKGLNPNVPMKPSGIEWLGDVPEHWTSKPVKRLGEIIPGFAFASGDFSSSGIRVLKIANIHTSRIDWSDDSYLPTEFYEQHRRFAVEDGDVVFALTRPIISTGLKAAIAEIGGDLVLLNQRNALFRPYEGFNKHFLYQVLFSSSFKVAFENKIDFTGQQPNISPVDIGNIKIPIPPQCEQDAIATFLEAEAAQFDALTAEAQRAIDLLQERRTALISAAVTGQIDVRPCTGKEPK